MIRMTARMVVVFLALVGSSDSQVVYNTTSGMIRGTRIDLMNAYVTQFLGVPYAEPPVGEMRFKPPIKKSFVQGVFNATSNDKICPQSNNSFIETKVMSEDCLTLDIYVPEIKGSNRFPLPIMIWFHGGWYTSGDSSGYTAFRIASEGKMVVVTVNYRLGILGFLNTMDYNSVGNFALRDQCLAIDWVAENIALFGGDPNRVTISGIDSGGSSSIQLAMSALCSDKFQRVIAQSGSASAVWAYNSDPLKSAMALALESACPTDTTDFVQCLRNKTWEEIVSFQNTGFNFGKNDWAPSYSGDVFPDSPLEILRGRDSPSLRRFRSLDFLTGVCNEDGEVPFVMEINGSHEIPESVNETEVLLSDGRFVELLDLNLKIFPGLDSYEMDRLFNIVKSYSTDWKRINENYSNTRMMIRFYSDIFFNVPAISLADLHSDVMAARMDNSSSGRTYFYRFKPIGSWVPPYPWTQGSTHGGDIPFVFGFVAYFRSIDQSEINLSDQIIRYWSNFVKTGSPNTPDTVNPTWPPYNSEFGEYIELDKGLSEKSTSTFPYAERYAFWDRYLLPELERVRSQRTQKNALCSDVVVARDDQSDAGSLSINSRWLSVYVLSISLLTKEIWRT